MADDNTVLLEDLSTACVPMRTEPIAEDQEPGLVRRLVRMPRSSNVFLIDLIGQAAPDSITGGALRALMGGMEMPTGGNTFRVIKSVRLMPEAAVPFYTPGEIISVARAALSLNITEVARVLLVKRPTIYAWINDIAEPHAHNLVRLNELLRIARHWMRLSNKPLGAFVRQADRSGQSLVDFLSSEVIDEPATFRRLGALHKKLSALKPKRSVRDAALQHGMDLSDFKDQQDVIDWITGKRPESE